MSVDVHIHAESAADARAEMAAFLEGYKFAPSVSGTAVTTVAVGDTADVAPDKPRRGAGSRKGPTVTTGADLAVNAEPAPVVVTADNLAADPKPAAAAEPEKKLLTLDDVRAAAAPYIKKFTIAAAQEDLQYALDAAVGKRTMSALDDKNQDELAKAVAAFDAAAAAEARFPKPADWK